MVRRGRKRAGCSQPAKPGLRSCPPRIAGDPASDQLFLVGAADWIRCCYVVACESFSCARQLDLLFRPCRSPLDSAAANPIVRSAGKAPIANGRVQRHRLAVEKQRPCVRRDRRHHFTATSAATTVNRGRERYRDVQGAVLEVARDDLHKLGPKQRGGHLEPILIERGIAVDRVGGMVFALRIVVEAEMFLPANHRQRSVERI